MQGTNPILTFGFWKLHQTHLLDTFHFNHSNASIQPKGKNKKEQTRRGI
jgi:hypothetical protein